MGKKRSRSSMTSRGERRSIVAGVQLVREARTELDKGLNKLAAWRKGSNPWITVQGPSSNMRMVRRRADDVWGHPKRSSYNIYGKGQSDE